MDPAYGLRKIKIKELNSIYTGIAIVVYPEKKLISKTEEKIKIFNVKMFYKRMLLILFLTLFIVILSLLLNLYLKYIVDVISNNKNLTLIKNITLLFILFILLKLLLQFLKNKLIIKTNIFLDRFLSNKFIEHLFKTSYLFFKIKQTGEIISRFNDLNIIKNVIIIFTSEILFNILLFIASLFVCFKLNKNIFIIFLIIILINILVSLIMYFSYKKRSRKIIEDDAYFTSILTEYITNIETVKNLNIIEKVIEKIKKIYLNNTNNLKYFLNKINLNTSIKYFINELNYIFIIFITAYFLIINEDKNIGDLILISIIYNLMITSLNTFYNILPEVSMYKNALYKIKEILKYKTEEMVNNVKKLNGDINVSNLSITYNNIDYINKNLSFKIVYGKNILIHGKSGSGKSTFIKILKKYINTYDGKITINNEELKNIDYAILNKNILYISQKEKLFTDTIENNIKINNNDEEKYKKIISLTFVNKIINNKRLKDKYFIEENSFNISGGEKQRIILARGLMNEFEYLVLDEVLSEVDKHIEINIINNLKKEYKDKTIIYITHDEKLKSLFDYVIKF